MAVAGGRVEGDFSRIVLSIEGTPPAILLLEIRTRFEHSLFLLFVPNRYGQFCLEMFLDRSNLSLAFQYLGSFLSLTFTIRGMTEGRERICLGCRWLLRAPKTHCLCWAWGHATIGHPKKKKPSVTFCLWLLTF